MTTLPTTSNFRLPRVAGAGGPTLPPTAPAGGPGGLTPSLTPADVWRIIRGNVWLILATVVLAIAVGIGIYYYLLRTDPKYRSLGQLLVNRPYRVNPTNQPMYDQADGDFNLSIEQRTQQAQLQSESLWSDVLQNNDVVRNSKWFKKFQDKVTNSGGDAVRLAEVDLDENLRATPIPDSKLIQLTMDSANADDAHDIVEAIGNAHIRNQQQRTFDRTNQELEQAKQWQSRYVNLAKQTKDKMNAQMNRASVDAGRQTIKEMEMSQLIGAQTKARLDRTEAEGQMNAVNEQVNAGKDPYQVDMMVRNDPSVVRLTARLDELDLIIESQVAPGAESRDV